MLRPVATGDLLRTDGEVQLLRQYPDYGHVRLPGGLTRYDGRHGD